MAHIKPLSQQLSMSHFLTQMTPQLSPSLHLCTMGSLQLPRVGTFSRTAASLQKPSSPIRLTSVVSDRRIQAATMAGLFASSFLHPETAEAATSLASVGIPAAFSPLAVLATVSSAVADACAEELGTDLNTAIIVACVLEFVALTGAAVGGEGT